MTAPLPVTFAAGTAGRWRVDAVLPVIGETLPFALRLEMAEGQGAAAPASAVWHLRGTTSNIRYTHAGEAQALRAVQAGLARPQATQAALIPIRKSPAWWAMAQDERRAIFEEQSRHIAIGMEYLPGVARRLHHCRELGEPFDFLTWFEFAPADAPAFDHMLVRLRQSREWEFVEREVDVRLTREG